MRRLGAWVVAAALVLAAPAAAQAPAEPVAAPVTTHHAIELGGRRIAYAATVSETVLDDPAGHPAATIFSTAYVRDDAGDRAGRPVVFFFNGGPGSSSDQLHTGAFGPLRTTRDTDAGPARGPAPARPLAPNPYSLLDAADLVFVDPVGTGFSRVLPGGSTATYWTVPGDAASIAQFIRQWLKDNGRTASPLYICGESYGGLRLAVILGEAPDLKVTGAIFLSPLLDQTAFTEVPGNDMPYVILLPGMAADAWYHHKGVHKGATAPEVFRQAARFAETDYVAALLQGSSLGEAQRRKVAGEVGALIGLSPGHVLAKDLRVTEGDFVTSLLADKGERIGRTDGRYVGQAAALAHNRPPFDDPAIAPGGGMGDVMKDYLVNDLGFRTDRPYVTLSLQVNAGWNWSSFPGVRAYSTVTPFLTRAMKADPGLRVFAGVGYFDLATPALGTIMALDHAGLPADRVTIRAYKSGHTMYQHEPSLRALSADLHTFLTPARS